MHKPKNSGVFESSSWVTNKHTYTHNYTIGITYNKEFMNFSFSNSKFPYET